MVELVRQNTGLSYEKSRVAVGTVLGHLQEAVPSVAGVMEEIVRTMLKSKVCACMPSGGKVVKLASSSAQCHLVAK